MLSNYDLQDICNSLKLPLIGVFSKDKLPQKRSVGSYYVNMQDRDAGSGTHWVFFKIFSSGHAAYFDSFGISCPIEIKDFLKPFAPFAFSNRQIQDLKSENCGRFCILFDYYFSHQVKKDKLKSNDMIAETYDDWLNSWSIDSKLNDKILKERINQLG
jgi:hypothetical protein